MEEGVPSPKIAKTRDGKNEHIVLSKSILNEVVTNKASVLSSDATMDSRFSAAHSVIMQGIRSTMTVPLIHHDELLGIMHLDSMIATNAFTEKDLQIFGGIGGQAAVAIHNSQLARKIEHEAKTRAQFQRLLSPNLVDQVVQGKLQLEKGGALSEVTLLFSDIRGFTTLSEKLTPHEVVEMLNAYFTRVAEPILAQGGTLDKYIGDAVMAEFGSPVPYQDHARRAIRAALGMAREAAAFKDWMRDRFPDRGLAEFGIGIGLHTGMAVCGAIGAPMKLDYTAIGDTVNAASRLEGVTKDMKCVIACSQATLDAAGAGVRTGKRETLQVKGRAEAIVVYEILGIDDA
jgi:adenylate cyclase